MSLSREDAVRYVAALEAGLLNPPQAVSDPQGWDRYWTNQIDVGALEQGFSDMMSSDPALPPLLERRDARTVLCAGNGLSNEALALALMGFHVTALDISSVPAQLLVQVLRDPGNQIYRNPGLSIADDGGFAFNGIDPIDPGLCPAMHRSAHHAPRHGGTLSFVTGDLMDPGVCAGPFDVVIERRTVQLFPEGDRRRGYDRLVSRLGERGVFVSHEHRGRWKPGEERVHYASAWGKADGLVLRSEAQEAESVSAPRLAYLVFSTG